MGERDRAYISRGYRAVASDSTAALIESEPRNEAEVRRMRVYWFYGACFFASFVLATTVILWQYFGLAVWQPIIAIILSMPLSYLATRFASDNLLHWFSHVH